MSLEILGHPLKVINPSAEFLAWLEERWIFPQHQGICAEQGDIELEHMAQAIPFPKQAGSSFESLGFMLESRIQNPEVWLSTPGGFEQSGAVYNVETRRIRFWGKLEGALYAVLFLAMGEVLAYSGLLPLHCSIAVRDGKAMAFLGPSGRGKTSTLRRALAAGWGLVAEDFAWLEPQTLRIYGWDKGVRVLPHDLPLWQQIFPDLRPTPLVYGKHAYTYEQLGYQSQQAYLERLIMLERDPNQTTAWLSLPTRDAVMALWQATGVPVAPQLQSRFAAWNVQAARGLQTSRLILGQGEPFESR